MGASRGRPEASPLALSSTSSNFSSRLLLVLLLLLVVESPPPWLKSGRPPVGPAQSLSLLAPSFRCWPLIRSPLASCCCWRPSASGSMVLLQLAPEGPRRQARRSVVGRRWSGRGGKGGGRLRKQSANSTPTWSACITMTTAERGTITSATCLHLLHAEDGPLAGQADFKFTCRPRAALSSHRFASDPRPKGAPLGLPQPLATAAALAMALLPRRLASALGRRK